MTGSDRPAVAEAAAAQALLAGLPTLDLLDSLGLGAVVHDRDGAIVACNAQAARLLGLTVGQLLGRDSFDPRWRAVGPTGEAMPGERHPALVALRTGRTVVDQLLGVEVPDAGLRWLSVTARPLPASSQAPGGPDPVPGVIAVFRDVTDSGEAAPALRASERRYRRASELAPVGIAIIAGNGRAIRANDAFTDLVGRTELALQEQPWWEAVTLVEPERTRAAIADSLRTRGGAFSADIRIRADGAERIVRMHARAIDQLGPDRGEYVVVAEDVTADVTARRQLERRADRDPLTGLLHVRALLDRLAHAAGHEATAVAYVDVDRFKTINDTWGHAVGDTVLQETARRLSAQTRESDLVARAGGDEFIIALRGMSRADAAQDIVRRLVLACREPVATEAGPVPCTVSAGLAVADPAATPDELMRRADRALYAAKAAGRNRWEQW